MLSAERGPQAGAPEGHTSSRREPCARLPRRPRLSRRTALPPASASAAGLPRPGLGPGGCISQNARVAVTHKSQSPVAPRRSRSQPRRGRSWGCSPPRRDHPAGSRAPRRAPHLPLHPVCKWGTAGAGVGGVGSPSAGVPWPQVTAVASSSIGYGQTACPGACVG